MFKYNTHYSCRILIKLQFSRQIFEKFSNAKFHNNWSRGSRVIPWGRTETDRQTAITKLIFEKNLQAQIEIFCNSIQCLFHRFLNPPGVISSRKINCQPFYDIIFIHFGTNTISVLDDPVYNTVILTPDATRALKLTILGIVPLTDHHIWRVAVNRATMRPVYNANMPVPRVNDQRRCARRSTSHDALRLEREPIYIYIYIYIYTHTYIHTYTVKPA